MSPFDATTSLTQDKVNPNRRDTARQRRAWERVRNAEKAYETQLRKVARHIGDLVRAFNAGDATALAILERVLERYSETLRPWAQAVGGRMLADVSARDERAWADYAKMMGYDIRRELQTAETGVALRKFLDEQVTLITSLPLDAAKRVHEIATGQLYTGQRAEELAKQIYATGEVTKSRATLIARTETSRAATGFTMVRAKSVGSEGYVWRTSRDYKVRKLHKDLEGTFHRWDDPPIAGENNERAHPGMIYNCFPGDTLTVIPDVLSVIRGVFTGDLIVLVAGDATIECTPNHPVLTTRGFLPARFIKAGDDLLAIAPKCRNAVVNEVHNKLVRFDELFQAQRTVVKNDFRDVVNLYGDIVDQEIEIASVEENLSLRRITLPGQFFSEDGVAGSNGRVEFTASVRCFAQVLKTCIMSLLDMGAFFFDARALLPYQHLFMVIAWGDSVPSQYAGNSRTRNKISLRDLKSAIARTIDSDDLFFRQRRRVPAVWYPVQDADTASFEQSAKDVTSDLKFVSDILKKDTGLYAPLRVVEVRRRAFSGHVYTSHTARGYYHVGEALAIFGNCRCTPEVVIPDKIE